MLRSYEYLKSDYEKKPESQPTRIKEFRADKNQKKPQKQTENQAENHTKKPTDTNPKNITKNTQKTALKIRPNPSGTGKVKKEGKKVMNGKRAKG